MQDIKDPCFFTETPQLTIIDGARLIDGQYYGQYSRETLEQVQQRYPGAQVGDFDTVYDRMITSRIRPPKEITKERYWEMLEILPPVNWINTAGFESFKMSERTIGNITGIFVRIGGRYFELENDIRMKHADIIALVEASEAFKNPTTPEQS